MRSIGNIAALLAALTLLAGCDGGGPADGAARAEFDAYEARVDPILQEEERIRSRYNECKNTAESLGTEEGLQDLVRRETLPAYERLDQEAETVRPEGGRLRAIHFRLENYLSAKILTLKTYLEWARQGAVPARELTRDMTAISESRQSVTVKVERIDELVRAGQREGNSTLVGLMQKLLKDDPVMAVSPGFFQIVTLWLGGQITDSAGFAGALDEKVDPYYTSLGKAIDEALTEHAGNEKILEALGAASEYRQEMLPCLTAIRTLIRTHATHDRFIKEVLGPLREKYDGGEAKADELLREYRKAARDYRASL